MMEAVHLDRLCARQTGKQAVGCEPNLVLSRIRRVSIFIVMGVRARYRGRNVLNQFPTAKHVQALCPETNAQYGKAESFAELQQLKIYRIPFRAGLSQAWMRWL